MLVGPSTSCKFSCGIVNIELLSFRARPVLDLHDELFFFCPLGTGCAPFRSFIEERVSQSAGGKMSVTFGHGACFLNIYNDILVLLPLADCVLFFGCRNSNKDYFFRDEWQLLVKNGSLQLFTAFSRDQVRLKKSNPFCFSVPNGP